MYKLNIIKTTNNGNNNKNNKDTLNSVLKLNKNQDLNIRTTLAHYPFEVNLRKIFHLMSSLSTPLSLQCQRKSFSYV